MGLIDKFKNLFTEEYEEEEKETPKAKEEKEPIKKEVMQVEIPAPARRSEPTYEKEEFTSKEEKKEPEKDEFKFPFFDDEDFNTLEKQNEEFKPRKKSSYRKESSFRKEPKEVYNPPKEEKHVFKPTPIISPVYGILDKNYQKDDIKKKNERPRTYYNPKEATVDEIRNKAYGTLEDDLETTLFGRNRILFDEEEKKEDKKEILIDDVKPEETLDINEEMLNKTLKHGLAEVDDELTDLLEEELGKEEKTKEETPKKISDTELFDMIDSMYQKGDKK